MKKTFKEILEIDNIVGNLYRKDPKIKESKFGYAYDKFYKKNYMPTYNERADEVIMARLNNALDNKDTKEVLVDPTNVRGYKYSKEGLKKCIEEENKIIKEYDTKEVEIIPYISSLVPEGLTEEEKELLTGIVI